MKSHESYQTFLKNLNDAERRYAPLEMMMEGDSDLLLKGTRVSVVGSRAATQEGIVRARLVTEKLVRRGIIVVSGLAAGIDTVAHSTAISTGGKTIAVLGTTIDRSNPVSNLPLLNVIKESHLAMSQFHTNGRGNFPLRNRTMALISDATIIIEATENSGTIHQGWEALRLGRKLFILQNVTDKLFWAQKMLDYGAQVMTRDNADELLDSVYEMTSSIEFQF